jgi:diaminopimelate epimerase
MELIKAHGSRNEIFIAGARPGLFPAAGAVREFVRRVCDRQSWTGGGDGVYFYDVGSPQAQAWFFNPDGSDAEFCGNGMRVLGRHILDLRGTETETITSGSRDYTVLRAATTGGVAQVELEMPPVAFGPAPSAPFDGYTAVSVPNPHLVAIVEKYSEPDLIAAGTLASAVLPEGANVSFLVELGPDEIFVRTFERGAGLTPSCGSGIVASRAVYSREAGVDPERRILVRNAGGVARAAVRVRDGRWFGVLEGNATVVYRGEADMSGARAGAQEYARDEIDAYAALDAENAGSLAAAGVYLGATSP